MIDEWERWMGWSVAGCEGLEGRRAAAVVETLFNAAGLGFGKYNSGLVGVPRLVHRPRSCISCTIITTCS